MRAGLSNQRTAPRIRSRVSSVVSSPCAERAAPLAANEKISESGRYRTAKSHGSALATTSSARPGARPGGVTNTNLRISSGGTLVSSASLLSHPSPVSVPAGGSTVEIAAKLLRSCSRSSSGAIPGSCSGSRIVSAAARRNERAASPPAITPAPPLPGAAEASNASRSPAASSSICSTAISPNSRSGDGGSCATWGLSTDCEYDLKTEINRMTVGRSAMTYSPASAARNRAASSLRSRPGASVATSMARPAACFSWSMSSLTTLPMLKVMCHGSSDEESLSTSAARRRFRSSVRCCSIAALEAAGSFASFHMLFHEVMSVVARMFPATRLLKSRNCLWEVS